MKNFVFLTLLMINSAYALEIKDRDHYKVITFDSNSNDYVSYEVFTAMASFLTDPLESQKSEYVGKKYYIKEYTQDDNDMDFSYKIKFIIDPIKEKLQIEEGPNHKTISFEGELASLILKGLLFRRTESEDFYTLTTGKFSGTFTIETSHGVVCKYDYRENENKLQEKYAQCKMTFH